MKTITFYTIGVQLFIFLFTNIECEAQQEIQQNGGFEIPINTNEAYPTISYQVSHTIGPGENWSQLQEKCKFWEGGCVDGHACSGTADWFTTQTLPDALQGGCPINSTYGSNEIYDIINATPKLETHDNSLFYGGFGPSEYMRNIFSRNTYPQSQVKISFWFALRSDVGGNDVFINIRLIGSEDYQDNRHVAQIQTFENDEPALYGHPQAPLVPCQWYYYESDWINTGVDENDDTEFSEIQIGGGDPNYAGDFFSVGYVYIDDVKVLNGRVCCPDHAVFENNNNLPAVTQTETYIHTTNCSVSATQSVVFKSMEITHFGSWSTGPYYIEQLIECNAATMVPNPQLYVHTPIQNVITIGNDGYNDWWCIEAEWVEEYDVYIYNRFGTLIFKREEEDFPGNFVCIWNGICELHCDDPDDDEYVSDGEYFYVLRLRNHCDQEEEYADFITVLGSPNKTDETGFEQNNEDNFAIQEVIFERQKEIQGEPLTIQIMPNPNNGVFFIKANVQERKDIMIHNVLGNTIFQSNSNTDLVTQIDISNFAYGVYFVKITTASGKVIIEKVVYNK